MQIRIISAVPLTVALICSCQLSYKQEQQHPLYFDKVIDSTYRLLSTHPEKAVTYIDSAFTAFPHPGPIDLLRKYDFKRGFFQGNMKDDSTAMIYADSALGVFKNTTLQTAFAEDYGSALYQKGDLLENQKDYRDAYSYYYRGKVVIEEAKDTCAFYQYNDRLGLSCYNQGLYREAAAYFNESFNGLSHCSDNNAFIRFVYTQRDLNNIGLCYTMMRKPDSAFYYYDSTRRYITRNKDEFVNSTIRYHYVETALGVIYGSEGDAAYVKGDTTLTETLYKKSIQLTLGRDHDGVFAGLTQAKLAKVYLASGKIPEAGVVLNELKSELDSLPLHSQLLQMNYLEQQWHYYDQYGQPETAYRYLQAYQRLKDSIEIDSKQIAGRDMQGGLERIAGENQLSLLQKENQLKNVFLGIALVFSLMTVAIILLVGQNNRRARRHVAELTQLNQHISVQNDHMSNALSALEQSHRENTRMMKVMAHDLRNPIGANISLASLMLDSPDIHPEHRQMLDLMLASSHSSLEMITDLLHSNISAEDLIKDQVDLQSLLKYCEEQLRFKAEEKRQTLSLSVQPATLYANREKIWRVLSNLITNAIKFSYPGTNIYIKMHREGEHILISVKDRGIGIPADIHDKIFDLFTEFKRPGTAGEEPFGLGLSISKQIVEAHGGKIWFESEEGKGTTFFVSFPTEEPTTI